MSDLVGNPEDRFSRVEAHIFLMHIKTSTLSPTSFKWVVTFEALLGCHDILILGKSPIKWRKLLDMTRAVDWD